VLPPDVNASRVLCHVEELSTEDQMAWHPTDRRWQDVPPARHGAPARATPEDAASGGRALARARVRVGLGYLNGARADEVAAIVEERERSGPFSSLADLASRAGAGRPALALLAWSGACDGLIARRSGAVAAVTEQTRRTALWQLGVAAPAVRTPAGPQLSLALELPDAPALRPLEAWERMVADYATIGMTPGAHPMALLRDDLPPDPVASDDLVRIAHGARVRIGGLVVARQRPGTANGIVFMLLEDERGTINLVVPPATYDRDRLIVRGEPLVFAEGRLERHPKAAGAINIVVDSLKPLDIRPGSEAAKIIRLQREAAAGAGMGQPGVEEGGSRDFAAVAPPVQSFASGRRR